MNITEPLQLRFFRIEDQIEARQTILKGLEERFGFLNETLNPDVDDIYNHFIAKGDLFIVGFFNGTMVCTGALITETVEVGRIVRVSVREEHRRRGFAGAVMECLESIAKEKGFKQLVLETNKDWDSAVSFYKKIGYQVEIYKDGSVHMFKNIYK